MYMFIPALCALMSVECGAHTVTDLPTKSISIEPTRSATNPLTTLINSIQFAMSMIRSCTSYQANTRLTQADREQIRKQKFDFVTVEEGADTALFKDSQLFRHVKVIRLTAGVQNLEHLTAIARYYPDLEGLVVVQPMALSTSALEEISSLRHLRLLELSCTVAEPEKLRSCLPKSLRHLQLMNSGPFGELPSLEYLRINQCRLESTLFEDFNAPRLGYLGLIWVDVPTNGLKSIPRFKNLRDFYGMDVCLSDTDLNTLRTNEFLQITIQNQQIG